MGRTFSVGSLGASFYGLVNLGVVYLPNYPSRGEAKGVHVPGWIRLCIEALIFGLAIVGMFSKAPYVSAGVLVAVFYHYFATQERITWHLKQK